MHLSHHHMIYPTFHPSLSRLTMLRLTMLRLTKRYAHQLKKPY